MCSLFVGRLPASCPPRESNPYPMGRNHVSFPLDQEGVPRLGVEPRLPTYQVGVLPLNYQGVLRG